MIQMYDPASSDFEVVKLNFTMIVNNFIFAYCGETAIRHVNVTSPPCIRDDDIGTTLDMSPSLRYR